MVLDDNSLRAHDDCLPVLDDMYGILDDRCKFLDDSGKGQHTDVAENDNIVCLAILNHFCHISVCKSGI